MRNTLIAVLASWLAIPYGSWASATGTLAGRVIPSGGPAATTVWVSPSDSTLDPIPARVAPDGSFHLDAVPAGPTQLAVETSEGLYVVSTPLAIAPGATRTVQLALGGRQDSSAPPAQQKAKKRTGVWANPLYATLIVVGSAIVVGVLVNELTSSSSTPTASPSTTTD